MHWIVNTALSREGGYFALIDQLERQGVEHTLVRKPPLANYLVSMHDDFDENGNNRPIMLAHIEGPVFVTGTVSMQAISRDHGWTPGYIDAPGLAECIDVWGDRMLNANARFGELGSIAPPDGGFFIRPDEGDKAFAGKTMNAEDFAQWRDGIIEPGTASYTPPETPVVIAPLRTIWAEYRCIIVNGRYVTGSRYKTGRTVGYSPDVGDRIVKFANECVADWNPRQALCLDIADTPEGLKVIELNAVSSAGFYSIDMGIYVDAITHMIQKT